MSEADSEFPCTECGYAMTITREDVPYRSLPGVTLLNSEVLTCPRCGERETVIPRIEFLDRTIAGWIIRKTERLSANETVFLRKHLGFSSPEELAEYMDFDANRVEAWEDGSRMIDILPDRFLRLLVATKQRDTEFVSRITSVALQAPMNFGFKLEYTDEGWQIITHILPFVLRV